MQLWGAKKAYTIQKFTDSTVVYADYNTYLSNASSGTTGSASLTVKGKKVGTSTVVVQDSAGTATILIEVKVQTLGANPNALTLEVSGSSQYVLLSGGTTPYTIKTQPNSSIATVSLGSPYVYAYPGSNAGSTFVTIKENGGDSIQIPITVVGRITFKPSSLTVLAGNTATDTISGGTAPYAIYNYDATKLSAPTISGSVLTVNAPANASTGTTYVSISDNSVPKLMKELSIYVTSPYLSVSTDTIRVVAGQTNYSTYVSNGTGAYSIQTAPTNTIATATMSGSYVYVTGVAGGITNVVIKDATTPTAKTVTIPIKVTSAVTALSASVSPVSVGVGSDQSTVISGGTTPYSIQTAPSSSYATASISSAMVTVHGVAAGSTSMVVKDASSPAKTLTIQISVSTGGGGTWATSGSLSFTTTLQTTSTVRSFSTSGIPNGDYTGTGGAGAYYSASSKMLIIFAYRPNSYATKADLTILELFSTGTSFTTGTYNLTSSGTNYGTFVYEAQISATDTASYLLTSGTATLSTLTGSAAAGTFTGSGLYVTGSGTVDMFTLTSGTFNVPIFSVGLAQQVSPNDLKMREVVENIIRKAKARQH